jgi:hypothetical protein
VFGVTDQAMHYLFYATAISAAVSVSLSVATATSLTTSFTEILDVIYSEGVVAATYSNGTLFRKLDFSVSGVTTVHIGCNEFPSGQQREATTSYVGFDRKFVCLHTCSVGSPGDLKITYSPQMINSCVPLFC